MRALISGERVSSPANGFNPTWQRHVAAYQLCSDFLGPGRVLDLGCGVGHSVELLTPRESVGVDLDPRALCGQQRETHVADMRALPFAAETFDSVLAVQSLEHVPDPQRVLDEIVRVLTPGGVAVLVTPNRLTFGRPEEIIDPYHHVEYDAVQLRSLVGPYFEETSIHGLFGSARVRAIVEAEKRIMERILALDALGVRRALPRRLRQLLYDAALNLRRRGGSAQGASKVTAQDFHLANEAIEHALDLVAVGRGPRPAR